MKQVPLMAALKYSLFFLITACSFSTFSTEINFDNNLSNCIKIEKAEIIYDNTFPTLKASINELKPTSECGCRSLVSSYSSFVETSDYKSHLMTGKFVFLEGNSLSLPVATTQRLINNNKLLITLSCALPD